MPELDGKYIHRYTHIHAHAHFKTHAEARARTGWHIHTYIHTYIHPHPRPRAFRNTRRGACQNRMGNFDDAIKDYTLALEKDQALQHSPKTGSSGDGTPKDRPTSPYTRKDAIMSSHRENRRADGGGMRRDNGSDAGRAHVHSSQHMFEGHVADDGVHESRRASSRGRENSSSEARRLSSKGAASGAPAGQKGNVFNSTGNILTGAGGSLDGNALEDVLKRHIKDKVRMAIPDAKSLMLININGAHVRRSAEASTHKPQQQQQQRPTQTQTQTQTQSSSDTKTRPPRSENGSEPKAPRAHSSCAPPQTHRQHQAAPAQAQARNQSAAQIKIDEREVQELVRDAHSADYYHSRGYAQRKKGCFAEAIRDYTVVGFLSSILFWWMCEFITFVKVCRLIDSARRR
jgi:hypothetical protein